MGEVTDLLKRVQEITVGMSNDSYSATDRAAAADEVDAIREDLIRLANTEIGDRYSVSGSSYDAPALMAMASTRRLGDPRNSYW